MNIDISKVENRMMINWGKYTEIENQVNMQKKYIGKLQKHIGKIQKLRKIYQ